MRYAVLVLTLMLLLSSATTSRASTGIPNSNPNVGFWAASDSNNSTVGVPGGNNWANTGKELSITSPTYNIWSPLATFVWGNI